MTFVFSPPLKLESPHKNSITDGAFYRKSNLASYVSSDCISIWNLQNSEPLLVTTIPSQKPHKFYKSMFIDHQTLAVLTTTRRIYLITLKSNNFTISDHFIEIPLNSLLTSDSEEPTESNAKLYKSIIFFQKVGKHIFVLTNTCNIFYANLSLTKIQTRQIKIDSLIIKAQSTSESLFILLESGRIAEMKMNQFEFFPLPTTKNFCVDRHSKYICLFTMQNQWQLWSLPNLQFIETIGNAENGENPIFQKDHYQDSTAIFSPVSSTCAFFTNTTMKLSYFTKVISVTSIPQYFNHNTIELDMKEKETEIKTNSMICDMRFPIFDSYGQILLFTASSSISNENNSKDTNSTSSKKNIIYLFKLATAASTFSDSLSAPITSSHVLLPLRDNLFPVKLPDSRRGRLALFGEMALAVATDHSVLVLPFTDKICPSVSDGAAHSQFIKNGEILGNKQSSISNNNDIDDGKTVAELINKYVDISIDMKWIELPIDKVEAFAWSSNTLCCLSSLGSTIYTVNISNLISLFIKENIVNKMISTAEIEKVTNNENEIQSFSTIFTDLRSLKKKFVLSSDGLSNYVAVPKEKQIYSSLLYLISSVKKSASDSLMKDSVRSFTVKGRPLALSASGNKLLITFSSQLSFYSIDTQKLVSTTSLGKSTTIKNAAFLSSETIATLTLDFHLLLIYHTKVVHRSFDDVLAFQLTGSNGWPLMIIGGETWRLLGANYSELELDFDSGIINNSDSKKIIGHTNSNQQNAFSLMIGVDGFSIICISPFQQIDFIHLVVCQSLFTSDDERKHGNGSSSAIGNNDKRSGADRIGLNSSSMASAVSILSQLTEERRLKILQKVGAKIPSKTSFDRFLSLIDRYTEIEDSILSYVLQNNERFKTNLNDNDNPKETNSNSKRKTINIDYPDFFKLCFSRNWFLTAAELMKNSSISKQDCLRLVVKSNFNAVVVDRFFERFNDIQYLSEIDDEITSFFRIQFVRNDFRQIADLLAYFDVPIKRFIIKMRRERETNSDTQFSVIINEMKKCSRQQLIDLSSAFEETNAFDLAFCCNFCVNNFSKCIECIEKQQRMLKFIDTETLKTIGYL